MASKTSFNWINHDSRRCLYLQQGMKCRWTDAALMISSAAIGFIGILASAGVFNFIGTVNAAYLSYGMYAGAALFFLIAIVKMAVNHYYSKDFFPPINDPKLQSINNAPLNVNQTETSQRRLIYSLPIVPAVIELDYSAGDYKKTGVYYGQQVAPQISAVLERCRVHLTTQTILMAQKLWTNIPKNFQDEIDGVVEGFNSWAALHNKRSITREQLSALHLIPDAFAQGNQVMGCSIIIGKDPITNEIIVGRTLDWSSNQQMFSEHVLVIVRKYGTFNTVEFGIPGFVGAISGIRQDGFSVFMNVCASDGDSLDMKGMPAVFLNRLCLMQEKVHDMKAFLVKHRPIGQYHLTVADKTSAATYYLRTKRHSHVDDWERTLSNNDLLIVTNCHYSPKGYGGSDVFRSFHRHQFIQTAFSTEHANERLKLFIQRIFKDESSFLSNNSTLQFIRFNTNKPESIHCSFANQHSQYGFAPSRANLLKLHKNTTTEMWEFSHCRKQ